MGRVGHSIDGGDHEFDIGQKVLVSILLTQMNFLEYVEMCTHTGGLQWNLSNVVLYSPKHIEQCTYKAISDLGTPLYTGQQAGHQWCPL